MNIVVTGGAGFIGSCVVRTALERGYAVLNYDALTYAANPLTLSDLAPGNNAYRFLHGDIADSGKLYAALKDFRPDAIIHCAAETHVDRSIDEPAPFIHTNIVGTQNVLEAAYAYWSSGMAPKDFRLIHVSTDEVFGSIPEHAAPVCEDAPYDPSSPYAASKAAADHLVRAYGRTYGLPVILTNCGNNYGPYQFPEKLIPHMILCALAGDSLPVYGEGKNLRDWIHVQDHADALLFLIQAGTAGETYLVGAEERLRNIDIVHGICDMLDRVQPRANGSYRDLIAYVSDRPGHDHRYAVNPARLRALGWAPKHSFTTSLADTISWYLNNSVWTEAAYQKGYVRTRIGRREGAS